MSSSSRTRLGTCTRISLTRKGTKTIRRIRRSVSWVYEQLGHGYWTRAYRMSYEAFESLYRLLLPGLREMAVKNSISMSFEEENYAYKPPNGPILPTVRLACAIRYFAGGSAYDIALTYGISCSAVHDSVSIVVDAINHYSPALLAIKFPENHDDQRQLAEGFSKKSEAGFSSVVGALDGLLIWIHKPSENQCQATKVGAKKYMCGRKKKYALNMQATICDAEGHFLDVSILFGGASSNLIAFEASEIIQKLQTPGFLAPGLHIIGDNAYVNTISMATPYPNVKSGSKDAYNFYLSPQLRIKIECAFGMLVHRWGILQKPMSSKFPISKIIAITLCLCKLHNYCINARLASPASTATDALNITIRNGININRRVSFHSNQRGVTTAAEELIGGGDHFDDIPRTSPQTLTRVYNGGEEAQNLPRERLHNIVLEKVCLGQQ